MNMKLIRQKKKSKICKAKLTINKRSLKLLEKITKKMIMNIDKNQSNWKIVHKNLYNNQKNKLWIIAKIFRNCKTLLIFPENLSPDKSKN